MTTVGELGEFEVLRRMRMVRPSRGGHETGITLGPGDDAALMQPREGRELAATTDTLVEHVHYRREWIHGEALGARLAEANLSDLAAMAAVPRWALVSVGVRREHDPEDLVALQRGAIEALGAHGARIVGGNLTATTGAEWFAMTLLGEVEVGAAWTRAGARAGDLLAVTGRPGRAGAGARLARASAGGAVDAQWAPLVAAWLAPRARVTFARALAARQGVTAAIDISDGVAADLAHVCEASDIGVRIEDAAWPDDALLAEAASALQLPLDALRFGASDDYELTLAIEPAKRLECEALAASLEVPFRIVGEFTGTAGQMERISADGRVTPIAGDGYDHFRSG